MTAQVVWPQSILEVLRELPAREQESILRKVDLLVSFPRMYPVRGKGPFRHCRWFLAGSWIVFYRFVENTVYIRGLWPARLP